MVWQDIIITIANVILSYSIFNQVYQGFRNKKGYLHLRTGILTTIGLAMVTISYLSLNLYFSTAITLLNTLMWGTLVFQRIIYKKA